jgi:hypothetical protein
MIIGLQFQGQINARFIKLAYSTRLNTCWNSRPDLLELFCYLWELLSYLWESSGHFQELFYSLQELSSVTSRNYILFSRATFPPLGTLAYVQEPFRRCELENMAVIATSYSVACQLLYGSGGLP